MLTSCSVSVVNSCGHNICWCCSRKLPFTVVCSFLSFGSQLHHSGGHRPRVPLWQTGRLGQPSGGWWDEEGCAQRHAAVIKQLLSSFRCRIGFLYWGCLQSRCVCPVFSYRRRILGADVSQRERKVSSGSSGRYLSFSHLVSYRH